ncbi:MAG: hypothetical protein AB1640_12595 [bacterium]
MAWIRKINQLSMSEKQGLYRFLIPPDLFGRFKVHPLSLRGLSGARCVRFYCPASDPVALIELKRDPADPDPVFSIQVSDNTDAHSLEWDFLIVNDPDGPRFRIDVDEQGRDTLFGRAGRNLPEEQKALDAGLFPGQIRPGLRVTRTVVQCLDLFARTFSVKSIFLEALFYHNAIQYERMGFTYFEGYHRMRRIHEAFQPGGVLERRLHGSSPFRQPGFGGTIRGRSWAIHDGILDGVEDEILADGWASPRMYRMTGQLHSECTFPDARF